MLGRPLHGSPAHVPRASLGGVAGGTAPRRVLAGQTRRAGRWTRWLVGLAALLAVSAVACGARADEPDEPPPAPSLGALVAAYTRYGAGPHDVEVEITYTPADFYRALGQDAPPDVNASGAAVFLARESVHEGDLPPSPSVVMSLADGRQLHAATVTVITDGGHHRSTRLAFALDGAAPDALTLLVLRSDGSPAAGGEFTWRLPIAELGTRSSDSKVGR